jgi:hypothetical protein
MLKLVNALPCDLHCQFMQPPKSAIGNQDKKKGSTIDGARDLFYLPTEFYTKSSGGNYDINPKVSEEDGWKPFQEATLEISEKSSSHNMFSTYLLNATIPSGRDIELPHFDIERTLYFRFMVPGSQLWSKPFVLAAAVMQNRVLFNKHKAEIAEWSFSRMSDVLELCPPQIQYKRLWTNAVRSIIMYSKYWILNKTSMKLMYSAEPNISGSSESLKSGATNGEQQPGSEEIRGKKKTFPFSRSLVEDSIFRCDDEIMIPAPEQSYDVFHNRFFGGETVPVMLSPGGRKLSVLPTGLRGQPEFFYIYGVRSQSQLGTKPIYGFRNIAQVYSDLHNIEITSFPDSFRLHLSNTGNILLQTANVDRRFDSRKANFINFNISRDGFVYIGLDSSNTKMLSWMKALGFRNTGEKIRTNHLEISFYLYKRFFRARSSVRLGGCHSGFSVASYMYIILITDVPVGYVEATIEGTCEHDSDVNAPLLLNGPLKTASVAPWGRPLPNASIGDNIFVEIDSVITSCSIPLLSSRILLLQTRNSDKSFKNTVPYITFTLLQPSRVMICIDSELRSADFPPWLRDKNFDKVALRIEAMGRMFFIYEKVCGAEFLSLGGLGLPKNSPLCNYFVLIADEFDFQTALRRCAEPLGSISAGRSKDLVGLSALGGAPARGLASYVPSIALPSSTSSGRISALSTVEVESINEFWKDELAAGMKCSAQIVPFHMLDRTWSKTSIDLKRGNAGEITAGNCSFAVSVAFLPGVFQRTCLVTLLPRFIVVNKTSVAIRLLPFKSAEPIPESLLRSSMNFSEFSNSQSFILHPNEATAVFSFFDSKGSADSEHYIGPHKYHQKKKRWLRAYDAEISSALNTHKMEDFVFRPVCVDDIGEQFCWFSKSGCVGVDSTDSGVIRQLCFDNEAVLESHVTQQENIAVFSISVALSGQTVVITYRDVSKTPPFRIENRLTNVCLLIRQKGTSFWVELPPRSWRSFIWTDYYLPKMIEVCVKGNESNRVEYSMDKIGRSSDLSWPLSSSHESPVRVSAASPLNPEKRYGCLRGYIYADSLTRVLSLVEVTSGASHKSIHVPTSMTHAANIIMFSINSDHSAGSVPISNVTAHAKGLGGTPHHTRNRMKYGKNLSRVQGLKNQGDSRGSYVAILQKINASVNITGFVVKLVELHDGHSLILSRKRRFCDEEADLSVEKLSCKFCGPEHHISFTVFHIQIDDMRPSAKFPVVAAPSNSGFNSHLTPDSVITPVPQVHVLFEWLPNNDNMIHIRTFDIALQPLRLRIDMDFLLSLVKFSGLMLESTLSPAHLSSGIAGSYSKGEISRLIEENSLATARNLLHFKLSEKVLNTSKPFYSRLIFIELLHFSAVIINLEVMYFSKHLNLMCNHLLCNRFLLDITSSIRMHLYLITRRH